MTDVKPNSKILVALSGGVDSSVAAALLIRQLAEGQVEGAFMRCYSQGPYCTVDTDQADAAKVAATIGIPFHVFDFEKEYKKRVMDYFFKEYEAGRTPNPDVMCNKEIKFGLFLNKALQLGFDYIATGHYARVKNENGASFYLLTGSDPVKDQSYFLYLVGQKELAHTLFPVGDLTKTEVRKLARSLGLPSANRPDSTGICFVGEAPLKEFLMQKIKFTHGNIISIDGKLLGRHVGLPFYTIGQREGLGISASIPYYVVGKERAWNKLIVAPFGHESLFKAKFLARKSHWTAGREPKFPLKVEVKMRYRAKNVPATVKKLNGDLIEVTLTQKERAITPGQSAVFYDKKRVLGGSVIEKVID